MRIAEQVKSNFSRDLEGTKAALVSSIESLKHDLSLIADSAIRGEELRASAYADFFKAASAVATAQKWQDSAKELDAYVALTDTKARIAVYGTPEVVTALGTFFAEFGHLSC